MKARIAKKVIVIVTAMLSVNCMVACAPLAGMSKNDYRGGSYYPTCLVDADRALNEARLAWKDKECPDEFNALKDMVDNAYKAHLANDPDRACKMAQDAAGRAKTLICLPRPIAEPPPPPAPAPPPAREVAHLSDAGKLKKDESFKKKVYYGTTRVDKCTDKAPKAHKDSYGNFAKIGCNETERYDTGNDVTASSIKYGYVVVDIPVIKKLGETEGMNIEVISSDLGWQRFKQMVSSDDILIYVHGYNTSFNVAAIRCAQLAYDLNYKGKALFFSWPSRGGAIGLVEYNVDKKRANENVKYLAEFLSKIAVSTNKKIHIIAHSMGGYILAHALASIQDDVLKNPSHFSNRLKENKGKIINQVVFAAPDIAENDFRIIFTEHKLERIAQGFTLYSIKNDEVLKASRLFNHFIEKNGSPRLGDSSLAFFSLDGMDTVDAREEVVSQVFGHSYYAEDKRMVTDLFLLFNNGSRPVDRMLLGVMDVNDRFFWFLRP